MSQIEIIMYVALGFAAAALIALVLGRLTWSYAVRLGRRRMQRSAPAALAELQADRDRLRAEYAMLSRKLELRLEELKTRLAEQTAEVSRNRNRLDQMIGEVKKRDEALKEKDSEIAQLKEQMTPLENELATRTQSLQQLKEQLRDQEAVASDLSQQLTAARVAVGERDQLIASLRDKLRTGRPAEAAEGQADAPTGPERLRHRIEQLSTLSQQIESQRKDLTREHSELKALSEDIARSHKRRKRRQRELAGEGPEEEQEELKFTGEAAEVHAEAESERIDTIDSASRRLEEQLAVAERETAELQAELKELDATWTAKLAEISVATNAEAAPATGVRTDTAASEAVSEFPETPTAGGTSAELTSDLPTEHREAEEGEGEGEGEANVITLANRIRALQRDIIRR